MALHHNIDTAAHLFCLSTREESPFSFRCFTENSSYVEVPSPSPSIVSLSRVLDAPISITNEAVAAQFGQQFSQKWTTVSMSSPGNDNDVIMPTETQLVPRSNVLPSPGVKSLNSFPRHPSPEMASSSAQKSMVFTGNGSITSYDLIHSTLNQVPTTIFQSYYGVPDHSTHQDFQYRGMDPQHHQHHQCHPLSQPAQLPSRPANVRSNKVIPLSNAKQSKRQPKAGQKRKQLEWEHKDATNFKDAVTINERNPKRARRSKPLDEDTKRAANETRKVGACVDCNFRKVACVGLYVDPQTKACSCDSCGRYRNSQQMKLQGRLRGQIPNICFKFDSFIFILRPQFLTRDLKESEVRTSLNLHITRFTSTPLRISMRIVRRPKNILEFDAGIFQPRGDHLTYITKHTKERNGKVFLYQEKTLPIGCALESFKAIKQHVRQYVDDLLNEQDFICVFDHIGIDRLGIQLLKKVAGYERRIRHRRMDCGWDILRSAMKILALHYVLGRAIVFTPDCLATLKEHNITVDTAKRAGMTSALLNQQIKVHVEALIQEEISTFYEHLGRGVKQRSAALWMPITAAFLVFCVTLEMVQVSMIFRAASNNLATREKGTGHVHSTKEVFKQCYEVDNQPFVCFVSYFHRVFGSFIGYKPPPVASPSKAPESRKRGAQSPKEKPDKPTAMNPLAPSYWDGEPHVFDDKDDQALVVYLRDLLDNNLVANISAAEPQPEEILESEFSLMGMKDPQRIFSGCLMFRFLFSFRCEQYIYEAPRVNDIWDSLFGQGK